VINEQVRYQKVRQFLETEKARLSRMGIRRVGIFGSVVRGEDRPDSDLDILIDLDHDATLTLFGLIDLEQEYSKRLGQKVDLVIKDDLKPLIGQRVLDEVQYV
jgi:predicted nucleotidyltransferase